MIIPKIIPNDAAILKAVYSEDEAGGYTVILHFPSGAPKLPEDAFRGAWFRIISVEFNGNVKE